MKISEYIKEKLYLIVASMFTILVCILFLRAVQCNTQVIVVIVMLFTSLILAILIVEYVRRNAFYHNVIDTLASLDKKYLVTELIEEPNFLEGKILYETMSTVNTSMCEYVNSYRLREQEYKEYVEMWVHEIKTPLAASKLILSNHDSEISQSIEEELEKVEEFVEQALFYARSTTLEKDYMIREIQLQTSINKCIRKYAKTFIYKKIKIELSDIDEVKHTIHHKAQMLIIYLHELRRMPYIEIHLYNSLVLTYLITPL